MNREKYKYTWTHSTVHITELSCFAVPALLAWWTWELDLCDCPSVTHCLKST